jgi:hypothetical protein
MPCSARAPIAPKCGAISETSRTPLITLPLLLVSLFSGPIIDYVGRRRALIATRSGARGNALPRRLERLHRLHGPGTRRDMEYPRSPECRDEGVFDGTTTLSVHAMTAHAA